MEDKRDVHYIARDLSHALWLWGLTGYDPDAQEVRTVKHYSSLLQRRIEEKT